MKRYEYQVPISEKNEALVKDQSKCVLCGHCKNVCRDEITVARMFEIDPGREPICVNCGQCANICPTEAIHEKYDYLTVKEILHNKNGKKVAFAIAPAVRVALGEDVGLEPGSNLESKIATALRALGGDYAFDITFSADLTIMEEAMELVKRIQNGGVLPQFTSCCPAWVKYCEIFYPELLPNLSSAKSPISMQSAVIKTFFAKKEGIDPDDIINVVIAPCTAKKYEIERPELNYTKKDTDFILTTRELALLLKEENIDINALEGSNFDSPLGKGSGAGVIFGSTGGVMEAALRTAYYFITGENLAEDALDFVSVRGMDDIKEASVTLNGITVRVAVCNGMKNAVELIKKVKNGECDYEFIEVMNCPGGCIAGGGQPKMTLLNTDKTRLSRMDAIYAEDRDMTLRLCHENPEIIAVYDEFFGEPNSHLAHEILHTTYVDKSYLLKGQEVTGEVDNLKCAFDCESCVTKPCQVGCPLNNDITSFIKSIKEKDYRQAYDTMSATTVLMSVCGRICPHFQQCQGSCIKETSFNAVEIGRLEQTIGDMALENGWKTAFPAETRYNVAVVGAGPSGLTCAAFLRRNGIGVTLYEKYDYLGGLLVHGIPEFRLPKTLVKKVTDEIVALGVNVVYNTELGKDITFDELKAKYDAVYIACGANNSNKMNIPGEDLQGVYGGNEVLEHNSHPDYAGKTVIVSGGGNVAMDVSRTAKRNGAERVLVVYRRSEKEMPADAKEIEEAKEDGVEFLYQTNILRVIGEDKVEKIEVIKTKLVRKANDSRLSPVNIEGSDYEIPCDYVMMAIGSHPDDFVADLDLEKKWGKIAIDACGKTSDEKVFSGGDIAGTTGTVAWASRAGRNGAYSIIDYLAGK